MMTSQVVRKAAGRAAQAVQANPDRWQEINPADHGVEAGDLAAQLLAELGTQDFSVYVNRAGMVVVHRLK